MNIDPRHLAQLSLIVESGSFQAAADQLGLSQPALSRNIRSLEQRIGAPVFDRSARRAIPNELGRRLARSGLSIRIAEQQASGYSALVSSGSAGLLRIGAPPIIAGHFLTRKISSFVSDRPECRVELRVGLVHELRVMLERAQIDMVIGPRDLADGVDESVFLPIVDDRVGILCRVGHKLVKKSRLSASDFASQSWVAHSRDSMLRRQTEAALVAMGLEKINVTVETDSIQSVLEIVANTDLISTMPRQSTQPYLGESLAFVDFDHVQFQRPVGVVVSPTEPRTRIVEEFVNLMIEEPDSPVDSVL